MKDKLEMKLRKDLEESLTEKRFNHVMSVYRTAIKLAQVYNEDEYNCKIGALGHDLTKEWPRDRNLQIMNKYFKDEEVMEVEPAWHGYTASVVLKEIYGVDDLQILNAVKYHTLGDIDMDNVAKIVYIADFIEPTRKKNNVEHFLGLVGEISLDELLYKIMDYNLKYLNDIGRYVPEQTIKLFNKLSEDFS